MHNVLFDLDGTITDPKREIITGICQTLEHLGVDAPDPETLLWCIGPPLHLSFEKLLQTTDPERCKQALNCYREITWSRGLEGNVIYPGVVQMLESLSDYQLFIATSKPYVRAQQIVEFCGIERFFQGIYGSELDGRLSKKGDLITHIAHVEGLAKESLCMIGDREHDMIGARENGICGFGVLWGYGDGEELERAGASHVSATPEELVKVLKEWPAMSLLSNS